MNTRVGIALVALSSLIVASCGGGDDTADTTTTAATTPTSTVAPADTVAATSSTAPALVVDGATVVVANGNIVGGSAGRMTDTIAGAGFTTATPVNGATKIEDSIVYYTTADGAQAVATSLGTVMGGIDVLAMPDPIPTEDGTLVGGDVLLLLGNNQADKTLEQLGGIPADDGAAEQPSSVDGSAIASTVVVANANTIGGSAGRMSSSLEASGFTVGEPTNATRLIAESIVYYTAGAEADAQAVAQALGGVSVEAMPTPIPVDGAAIDGQVLVLLGSGQADKTIAELAG